MKNQNIFITFRQQTFTCFNCNKNTTNDWYWLNGQIDPFSFNVEDNFKYCVQLEDYYINDYKYKNLNNYLDSEIYPVFYSIESDNFEQKRSIKNGIKFKIFASQCNECRAKTIWIKKNDNEEIMIWPKISVAPEPNENMEEKSKSIFNEARYIFNESPRAAIILLRIVLEQNIRYIFSDELNNLFNDETKNNRKKMLGDLIQNIDVKKSLENEKIFDLINSAKVLGNNAAHSDEWYLNDNSIKDCELLFDIINELCKKLISNKDKYNEFITRNKNKSPK